MSNINSDFKQIIKEQRKLLTQVIGSKMNNLAKTIVPVLNDRNEIESLLSKAMPNILYCKHLYVLDSGGNQLCSNIKKEGKDQSHFGRNRINRPYMKKKPKDNGFRLSKAYISKNKKRPSLTAIQLITDENEQKVGFLGADFDLRELPHTGTIFSDSEKWKQVKGDPSIRGGLFAQTRTESVMDQQIDKVVSILEELIIERGVFHAKLHFSSSRGTIWHIDNPYSYAVHPVEELTDVGLCFLYPQSSYTEKATIPIEEISNIFNMFKSLRFADEIIYLRAASLNIVNGMIGLNFSCDGSHYMHWKEFLDKNKDFWFGSA